jgi:hypothetical protein
VEGLRALADPSHFQQKYGVGSDQGVLLFAMGDGNHSLATAKSIWEQIKSAVGMDHPARYALVEVENVHDEGLFFEPIHRVLFSARGGWKAEMEAYFRQAAPEAALRFEPAGSAQAMVEIVDAPDSGAQKVGVITSAGAEILWIDNPPTNLAVGTLQAFLDDWLKQGGAELIDYVHGEEVVRRLGAQPGNIGFYLPGMDKNQLFKTVILDGSLPRKTFSMGEAHEKRFYMECRKITA